MSTFHISQNLFRSYLYVIISSSVLIFALNILPASHNIPEIISILLFFCLYFSSSSLRVDRINIISPKNLMLLVFFARFVIIPITIIFFGYQKWVLPFLPNSEELIKSYNVMFIAFSAFVLGWILFGKEKDTDSIVAKKTPGFRNSIVISLILFLLFIFFIFFIYGSFSNYISSIFLDNYSAFQSRGNKLFNYLFVLLKFVIPFSIIVLALKILKHVKPNYLSKTSTIAFFSLIVIFFSLGPSRTNMIFPLLAFFAALIPIHIKIRFRDFVFTSLLFLFFAFYFGSLREKKQQNLSDKNTTSIQFVAFLQAYFGAPHLMTPLFHKDNYNKEIPLTIHSSLLETIPVLGKSFRETSGTFYYNSFYGRSAYPDQVFPTSGELYLNFGYLGVIIGFFIFGIGYSKIHNLFIVNTLFDPVFKALFFYLTLLFNGTIFLSFSVIGQFMFYNSILVTLFIVFRDRVKKGLV